MGMYLTCVRYLLVNVSIDSLLWLGHVGKQKWQKDKLSFLRRWLTSARFVSRIDRRLHFCPAELAAGSAQDTQDLFKHQKAPDTGVDHELCRRHPHHSTKAACGKYLFCLV